MPFPATKQPNFLPLFCSPGVVLSAVILGQLVVLLLILSPLGQPGADWDNWSLLAVFVLWVTLFNMGLLCLLRPWLHRLSPRLASLLSYLLALAATAFFLELAWWKVLSLWIEPLQSEQHALYLFRNLGISALVYAMALRYLFVRHQWEQRTEAENRFRMQALQARIHPHFLFNTLNTIAGLIRFDQALAEEALDDLAQLFRAGFASEGVIPLRDELALCRRYLKIEKLRLGERLEIVWDLHGVPENALVPSLSLQVLLENAVRYGIQPLTEGGTIRISGISDGKHIKISIENPLPEKAKTRSGNQLAHDNLHRRLHSYYGNTAHFSTRAENGHYTAGLRFPYRSN